MKSPQPFESGKDGPSKTSAPSSGRLSIYSWAFYDWANSAFATTVMAGFFPVFFKEYWSRGDVSLSTFYLGSANSLSSFLLAVLAPVLGAIADVGHRKKRFLFFFFSLGVVATSLLYFVEAGAWPWAVIFYVLASLGYAGGNIFYDALLVTVAPLKKLDYVSGLGYALGYLGGALLFSVNVAMYLKPEFFGLTSGAEAVKWSFVSVAVWWVVFSMPLFVWVEEAEQRSLPSRQAISEGIQRLVNTFSDLRKVRPLFLFLLAYLFYIDGVNTIIKMAVDYGMAIGFKPQDLITALLITNFIGFPAAIAFGLLGEKWGARNGIYLALCLYILITIWGFFMTNVLEFYLMAMVIGLVQGGIQSLSRSYYARFVPDEQAAEYFGFFNMLGKFSAVIGPALVGWVSLQTQSPRHSLLVIISFFVIGGTFLTWHLRSLKSLTSHSSDR